ncbi:MAG: F0F1 ATP synthase subunit B [Breznakibacter sp.]
MNLITPEPGLLIWSLISFSILVLLLGIFAWKPILQGLKRREETIEYSLKEAERSRMEMANLDKERKVKLEEARVERDNMLQEAKRLRDNIVADAKNVARTEADKILEDARRLIQAEKTAAIEDLKKQVAVLSVEMAGVLMKKELENPEKQQLLVEQLLKEVNFN